MMPLQSMTIYSSSFTHHGGKFKNKFDTTVLITLSDINSAHCEKLQPEFDAAAEILAKQNPARVLAKVDASENKNIADRLQIKGFPTLFFFK